MILEGLAVDRRRIAAADSRNQAEQSFAAEQQHAICDDICFIETAKPQVPQSRTFLQPVPHDRVVSVITTPRRKAGRQIGYVGNVILQKYDGPPHGGVLKILRCDADGRIDNAASTPEFGRLEPLT